MVVRFLFWLMIELMETRNPLDTNAWNLFVYVTQNILGNHHADNYEEIVETMIQN